MAYDPYQFAAARSNIAGSAAQGVGQALQQITGAIGEVAQQKIDKKKLVSDYKTNILPSAIKAISENYDIPPTKAAIIAAKAFPDPSTFEDPKEAKKFYIQQTTKIDDLAQTYLQYQDYKTGKAEKAAAESKKLGDQAVADSLLSRAGGAVGGPGSTPLDRSMGIPTPAGSAAQPSAPPMVGPPAPPQQAPSEGFAARPEFAGSAITGGLTQPTEAPQGGVSNYPEPMGVPAGSAAATVPYREDADKMFAGQSRGVAQEYLDSPQRKLLANKPVPEKPKSPYELEMDEIKLKTARAKQAVEEAKATQGAGGGNAGESTTAKALDYLFRAKDGVTKAQNMIKVLEGAKKTGAQKLLEDMAKQTEIRESGYDGPLDDASLEAAIKSAHNDLNTAMAEVKLAEERKKQAAKFDTSSFGKAERAAESNLAAKTSQEVSDIVSHMNTLWGNNPPMSTLGGPTTEQQAQEYAASKGYSPESATAAHDQFLRSRAGIAGSAASMTGGDDALWSKMISRWPNLQSATPEEKAQAIAEFKAATGL